MMFWQDKALHILLCFVATAVVIVPLVYNLRLSWPLYWSGLFPGLVKEFYDITLWGMTEERLTDSALDMGANFVGVLLGILVWSKMIRRNKKGPEVPATDKEL